MYVWKRLDNIDMTREKTGSQSHLVPNMSSNVEAALHALAASRVSEILITELDIDTAPPAEYATVVGACLNVPKCRGITVWGVSDTVRRKMANESPLLFLRHTFWW